MKTQAFFMNITEFETPVADPRLPDQEGKIFAKSWQSADYKAELAPIVLIHESLGSVAQWRNFPELLAEQTKRQVIAYDRLGFGQSSALNQPLDLDFVIDEAQTTFSALIQAINIQKFVVAGHSVGGGMAVAVAEKFPSQCLAVITMSAQSQVEQITLDGIGEAKQLFADPKMLAKLAKYHGDKAQWVLDAWTETWLDPKFTTWNLDAYLARIQSPILVIHGEHDQYATLAQPSRFIHLAQVEKQLEILPNCGHFPHQEQTQQVLVAIENFLQQMQ